MKNDTAFPVIVKCEDLGGFNRGLTKRELFAAMALQGLLSYMAPLRPEKEEQASVAVAAVQYADALIAELERE